MRNQSFRRAAGRLLVKAGCAALACAAFAGVAGVTATAAHANNIIVLNSG